MAAPPAQPPAACSLLPVPVPPAEPLEPPGGCGAGRVGRVGRIAGGGRGGRARNTMACVGCGGQLGRVSGLRCICDGGGAPVGIYEAMPPATTTRRTQTDQEAAASTGGDDCDRAPLRRRPPRGRPPSKRRTGLNTRPWTLHRAVQGSAVGESGMRRWKGARGKEASAATSTPPLSLLSRAASVRPPPKMQAAKTGGVALQKGQTRPVGASDSLDACGDRSRGWGVAARVGSRALNCRVS